MSTTAIDTKRVSKCMKISVLEVVPDVNCVGVIPEAAQPLWSKERSTGGFGSVTLLRRSLHLCSVRPKEMLSFLVCISAT